MNAQLIHDIRKNFVKKELCEEIKKLFQVEKSMGVRTHSSQDRTMFTTSLPRWQN